jgi:hypothetical protein
VKLSSWVDHLLTALIFLSGILALALAVAAFNVAMEHPLQTLGIGIAAAGAWCVIRYLMKKQRSRRIMAYKIAASQALDMSRVIVIQVLDDVSRMVESKYPYVRLGCTTSCGFLRPPLGPLQQEVMSTLHRRYLEFDRPSRDFPDVAAITKATESIVVSEMLKRRRPLDFGDRSIWHPDVAHKSRDWAVRRDSVFTRDRGRCVQCGLSLALESAHIHHVTPRGYGGSDRVENLATLCPACHSLMHPQMSRFHTRGESLAQDVSRIAGRSIERRLQQHPRS